MKEITFYNEDLEMVVWDSREFGDSVEIVEGELVFPVIHAQIKNVVKIIHSHHSYISAAAGSGHLHNGIKGNVYILSVNLFCFQKSY